MQHIREAFALFAREKRLWRYVVKPLGWTMLLYMLLLVLGYYVIAAPVGQAFERLGLGVFGSVLGVLLYGILWFFLSGMILLAIASLLSSLLWDKLSLEVEELLGQRGIECRLPVRVAVMDSIQRTLLSLILGVAGTIVGLCVPVVAPVLVAAYIGLLDFTAPAFARRGKVLRVQRSELKLLRERHSFAITAGLASIIPLVNVLMLPILVAGGTIMVARSNISEA